ncbi:site-specific integrase [Chitinophaga sp. CB10]|uniref:site-specific integrase n=1 Tax=Chitinophaga sp. CB10 TaxID=1891659 RepID=UPI0025BE05AC|nr:site-specific integrase [Chitinophaga sp. CB10]
MNELFSTNAWLYKSKANLKGQAPIYIRITLGSKHIHLSTGIWIDYDKWGEGQASLRFKDGQQINKLLDIQKRKLQDIYIDLRERNVKFGVADIKAIYLGKDPTSKTLLQIIDYHNNLVKSEIGTSYAQSTYNGYFYFKQKVQAFISHKKISDIPLKQLDYQFITEFENFLKVHFKNKQNTASKNLVKLKKMMTMATNLAWLDKNPYSSIRPKKEKPTRTYLTQEELIQFESKEVIHPYLRITKDCALLQIYTGASYIDLKELTTKNLVTGADGHIWLVYHRRKTKKRATVPLLPPALALIEKYADHPCRLKKGLLLPIISNQKMNVGLDKLMELCEILKVIRTHSLRRTFATTISVRNGVSMESTRDMLGQTDVRTTQIYAVVDDFKISDEMKGVFEKYKER